MKEIYKKIIPQKYHEIILGIRNGFLDGYSLKSYSQEGEDMILKRFFEGKQRGFYVDVGSHHPKRFSNTYFFYKTGWRGINIDPMPGSMKLFDKIRTRDINLECGIFESEDELSRPLTLHCKFCGSWFESEKADYLCPICEHDQIFVAYNCMNCGKWYFKDEPREEYFCKNKSCLGVRLVRRELNEVKEILGKDGIYLRKFEHKDKKFSRKHKK